VKVSGRHRVPSVAAHISPWSYPCLSPLRAPLPTVLGALLTAFKGLLSTLVISISLLRAEVVD